MQWLRGSVNGKYNGCSRSRKQMKTINRVFAIYQIVLGWKTY